MPQAYKYLVFDLDSDEASVATRHTVEVEAADSEHAVRVYAEEHDFGEIEITYSETLWEGGRRFRFMERASPDSDECWYKHNVLVKQDIWRD